MPSLHFETNLWTGEQQSTALDAFLLETLGQSVERAQTLMKKNRK